MKYVLLTLALCLNIELLGCDCEPLGPINDQQYNSYELIVVGTVKKIVKGDQMNTIILRVKQSYQGAPKERRVSITTPKDYFSCGIAPKRGEAWLIYARKFEGKYTTNECTRSKSLTRKARYYYSSKGVLEGDLAFLEQKIR